MPDPAALVFVERHCSKCRRLRPVEQFRFSRYCADCIATYNRQRNAAIQDGTWTPKTIAERAPRRCGVDYQPLVEAVAERAQPLVITPEGEHALRAAIEAFMDEFGFTALRVTFTRLEGEIAHTRRLELAVQGWIA
jgi:hypothetical protein